MNVKVAEYIAEFLVRHGMTDCFLVTGGGAMHLNDAIGHHKGIRCICNHHEQACAIAAEGYAKMSGRPAAVCVTSGPGAVNTLTGVMGAWTDSVPMFLISGQAKRETCASLYQDLGLRQLGDQETDIVRMVSSITKYAVMLTDPALIAYHLEKAWYLAQSGRKGPVWIDLPLDVQAARVETDTCKHFVPEQEQLYEVQKVPRRTVKEILEKIKQAKAPLILAGSGIRLGAAQDGFLQLLDRLQIPVVTAWNANDLVAWDHPLYAGMPGTVGTRPGNFAVQNCDLLLSLGCRMNIRMVGYNWFEFAKNAYKIIVDIDQKELFKPTVQPDMVVHADVRQLIGAMRKEAYNPSDWHRPWVAWCRGLVEKYPALRRAGRNAYVPNADSRNEDGNRTDRKLLDPYVFIDYLFGRLEKDDRIICSNGAACVVTFQAAKIRQGQRMFTNSGCAAMGYGLPAALGAAVSDHSRRTICIEGDGSIMMNLQELATVAYHRLDLKIFILNNQGYHSIRQTQANLFHPPFVGIDADSGVGFPDFGKLADAFAIPYVRLEGEEDVFEVLEQVLGRAGAWICEVMVDPERNFEPKAASKVLADGSIVSAALEDMYPFLEKEELEKAKYGHGGNR